MLLRLLRDVLDCGVLEDTLLAVSAVGEVSARDSLRHFRRRKVRRIPVVTVTVHALLASVVGVMTVGVTVGLNVRDTV